MFCQKCRTPLRLDSSLDNLNPTAFNLLIDASGKVTQQASGAGTGSRILYTDEQKKQYEDAAQKSNGPVFKKAIPPVKSERDRQTSPPQARHKDVQENPAMSFVMLTESQVVPPALTRSPNAPSQRQNGSAVGKRSGSFQSRRGEEENSLSHKMETTARLFEILSSRSDFDHPICVECTDILVEGMEKRLANATKERDAYVEFLKNANADLPTDEERAQAEEDLKVALEQEQKALQELEQLEAEKSSLEDEIAALDLEARQLDEAEENYWRDRNMFAQVVSNFQSEKESINLRYEHDSEQLEKLSRTNVYNDTFCISHTKSGFATINNLRLGRTTDITVPWAEVNAAWGMTLLLLSIVAEKLDFKFDGYILNPMGSTSTITKIDKSTQSSGQGAKPATTTLSLFYSSELPLSIGFLHRHFDAAMIAFLECVRQLGEHVQSTTAGTTNGGEEGLIMPCEIRKDKIGDSSIRLPTFEAIDTWNTSCKRVLTCCKFLLAHTSMVINEQRKSSS